MLTPGARPAIHYTATSTHGAAPLARGRRRGPRWLAGLAALTSAIALPMAAAGPASADQVRQRQQWVLSVLDVSPAWQVTQGPGVTVAVIDSGVDPSVSDLAGSVLSGPDFTGVHTPQSNPNWGAHGTWMASLIAGHGHGKGNKDGILGVAPRARILSIRVITDHTDPGYNAYRHEPDWRGQRELASAIRYAVRHGAQVISMSLGYVGASVAVRSALQSALAHNVVVVASSGNAGTAGTAGHGAPYSFPADYPGVIGVAAVNQSGQPAYFSSENLSVQVAAPGVNVPAQGRGSKYWVVSGTSPACALTAGVAALIKSRYPTLTAAQVRSAITGSSAHRPRGGYDDHVGFGTVDAAAALKLAGRLAKQRPAGQTGPGRAAASGNFGNGEAGVPAFPVPARSRERLLVLGGIGAGGLVLLIVALWLIVSGRSRRRAARKSRPIGVTATQGPPGWPLAPGPVGAVGVPGPAVPGGPAEPAGPGGAPRAGGPGGTDLDLRYPSQIYPAQPQRQGLPVQGYISQPGQELPVRGHLGQQGQHVPVQPPLAGQPGQLQIGPGQAGQQDSFGPPGQHGQPGGDAPGQNPAWSGYPGQTIPAPGAPAPGYGSQADAAPGQPGQGYPGPGYALPGYAGPGHQDPGYGAPASAPPGFDAPGSAGPGFTGFPPAGAVPGPGSTGPWAPPAQPDATGQADQSKPEWPFEDEPSAPPSAPAAGQAADQAAAAAPGHVPAPPRPLPRGLSDPQAGQGQRTVLPPGRTLLPQPETGGLVDEDPLTSPRFARDGRAERALRPGGYRPDWLSSRQGVTRPMSSPPQRPVQQNQPRPADQAAPGALPKRTRRQAQAWAATGTDQPGQAGGPQVLPAPAQDAASQEAAAQDAASQPSTARQAGSGPLPQVPAQPGSPVAEPVVPPASVQPSAVQPSAVQPSAVQPSAVEPSAGQPAARQSATVSNEGTAATAAQPSQPPAPGEQPPRGQQSAAGQLPRRQPMTHLAAQLRRDQQAGDAGPLPSVWDTRRPAAATRRPGQQDGPDLGDDQA